MRTLLIALIVGAAAPCLAQESAPLPDPWFSTFSIIAFDPATNELGVAVQSRAFAAGAAVPFAKPGVGAVATQPRNYGWLSGAHRGWAADERRRLALIV